MRFAAPVRYAAAESDQGFGVSEIDRKALEANFEGWRAERAPELKASDAFELYVIGLVLKDADLSDAEIAAGNLGGGDDGGVDGFYFFLNRQLMSADMTPPKDVMTAHLWIIQAKNEGGFGEKAIDKMKSFSEDLLDFSRPVASMKRYSQTVKDAMQMFRTHYEAIIAQPHEMKFTYVYASRSDHEPGKVEDLVPQLNKITAQLSASKFDFQWWGARNLIEAFRAPIEKTLSIDIVNSLSTPDGSFVCFAKLGSLAKFLTDEKTGEIRQYVLNPNVRDFQGDHKAVNKAIRATLGTTEVKEFWWLNNGITILAEDPKVGAGKLTLTSPELVNGLQTSYLVFNFFKSGGTDDRTVMLRVISPPDEQTRRDIIRATNNQTALTPLSLYATDDIHFNIEDLFKLHHLYYDRRKGQYRREKRPIAKIVSMRELSQSVMAIVLRAPNEARARPGSITDSAEGYNSVFDKSADTRVFLACVLLDRQVKAYLYARGDITRDVANDLQFYMDVWLAGVLVGRAEPSAAEIGKLAPQLETAIDASKMATAFDWCFQIYSDLGGDDKAAKGAEMPKALIGYLKGELDGKN